MTRLLNGDSARLYCVTAGSQMTSLGWAVTEWEQRHVNESLTCDVIPACFVTSVTVVTSATLSRDNGAVRTSAKFAAKWLAGERFRRE